MQRPSLSLCSSWRDPSVWSSWEEGVRGNSWHHMKQNLKTPSAAASAWEIWEMELYNYIILELFPDFLKSGGEDMVCGGLPILSPPGSMRWLKGWGQWWQVLGRCNRHKVTTPPSQVPWHSRHKTLQVELSSDKDEGSSRLEMSLNLSLLMPFIKTASLTEKEEENLLS